MQTPPLCRANIVFSKTAKGRQAIAQYPSRLNARERRILMIIDDATAIDAIIDSVPGRELSNAVSFLVREGLIAPDGALDALSGIASAEKLREVSASGPAQVGPRKISAKKARIARLKNPEIFTAQCRGGFASAALLSAPREDASR